MTQIRFEWEREIWTSDLAPMTRLVLFTLGTFFNKEGVAYPAQTTIAKASGLSARSVRQHLKSAIDKGWITVSKPPARASKCYQASIPCTSRTDINSGDIGRSDRNQIPQIGERRAGSDRHRIPPNTSTYHNTNTSDAAKRRDEDFEALWELLARPKGSKKAEALGVWNSIPIAERQSCLKAGVQLFASRKTSQSSDLSGSSTTPSLLSYLRSGSWRV